MSKSSGEKYLMEYLEYYDASSIRCKRWYILLAAADIVLSALIPFATMFAEDFSQTKYLIALMGSVITILSAFKATFGFHKNWVAYRTAAETLRYHKYLYETQSEPYTSEDAEHKLILRVNEIVDRENASWRSAELSSKRGPTKTSA